MRPSVSINTLSTAETRLLRPLGVLAPPLAARATMRRAEAFMGTIVAGRLGVTTGKNGYSVHPSRMVRSEALGKSLRDQRFGRISTDMPDVVTFEQQGPKIRHALALGNIALARDHLGWMLSNMPSEASRQEELELATMSKGSYVRISSGMLGEPIVADVLQNTPATIGVEIDASRHSVPQYLRTMRRLNEDYPGRAKISFDPGHIEQAAGPNATQTLTRILLDRELGQMLGSFELNQTYGDHQHVPLAHGELDLPRMGRMIAQSGVAVREIIVETSPIYYSELFSSESTDYLGSIIASFDS